MYDKYQRYGKDFFPHPNSDFIAGYSPFHQAGLYHCSADERLQGGLHGRLPHVRHWFLVTYEKRSTNDRQVEQAWRTMESN